MWHDPYLVGNGRWCSCCFPNGRPDGRQWAEFLDRTDRYGCNECAGDGRIPFSAEQIVAATVSKRRRTRGPHLAAS